MSLIHVAEVYRGSSHVTLTGAWLLPVFAAGLVLLHGTRAFLVRDDLAERWLQARGFTVEPLAVIEIRAYLARLRTARFIGSVLFLGLAVLSWAVFSIPIGVVSVPYLLSVLGAELLTPQPRRGRQREASLQRRPSDYFAPRLAVLAVRLLLAAGVVLAGVSIAVSDPAQGLVHLTLLIIGAGIYETCLRTIAARGLPVASADLARDTAVRVASSRTATAAAMSFAAFGATLSLALAVHTTSAGWWGRPITNQVMTWAIPTAIAAVIWLLQPVRSWHPRTA